MDVPEKTLAVIGKAVEAFLKDEQARESMARTEKSKPDVNLWGLSGRQEMMKNRILMQRKVYR